jgi:CHAD domain-containing protein
MTTQTPETTQIQLNGAVVALASPDRPPSRWHAQGRDRHGFTRRSPAGDVIMAYLAAHAARLKTLDPLVRQDAPDSVHQMRVAARRLRSTLQAYPAILPRSSTQHLRDELKWLGGTLAEARDGEVLTDYLGTRLDGMPPDPVLGTAQARTRAHFAPRIAHARGTVLDALNSARYYTMLAELDRLLADPPLTASAAKPAAEVLPPEIARTYRRTRRRMRRASQAAHGPGRDTALHETRKAARRARYAAEAAKPALGKKARRYARRMKAVQSTLGDHHDAVNAAAAAGEIGKRANLAGENAYAFGLLRERARHEAAAHEEAALRAWKRAKKRKARAWADGA